jgi:hypothetical protein
MLPARLTAHSSRAGAADLDPIRRTSRSTAAVHRSAARTRPDRHPTGGIGSTTRDVSGGICRTEAPRERVAPAACAAGVLPDRRRRTRRAHRPRRGNLVVVRTTVGQSRCIQRTARRPWQVCYAVRSLACLEWLLREREPHLAQPLGECLADGMPGGARHASRPAPRRLLAHGRRPSAAGHRSAPLPRNWPLPRARRQG